MNLIGPRIFDPADLAIIDRVYEAAWAEVEARDPLRDRAKDDERKAALRKRVVNLAHPGKMEFDPLYRKVVATIPQRWTTNDASDSLIAMLLYL
jgi:hypothetical protein